MKQLVFFGLVMLASCMKTPTPNQDFGKEVSSDEVNQALTQIQSPVIDQVLPTVQAGEYVYIERSNQVETLFPVTVEIRSDTVASHTDTSDSTTLVVTHKGFQLDPATGNMRAIQTTQETQCLEKVFGGCERPAAPNPPTPNPSAAVADASMLSMGLGVLYAAANKIFAKSSIPVGPTFGAFSSKIRNLSVQEIRAQSAQDQVRWTYHNLTVTPTKVALPSMVNLRSDCGKQKSHCGVPLNGTEVTWDQVDWTSEQFPVKYSFNLVFSSEVPFSANLLMSCLTTTIPYNDQRISVMQCDNVRDFTH